VSVTRLCCPKWVSIALNWPCGSHYHGWVVLWRHVLQHERTEIWTAQRRETNWNHRTIIEIEGSRPTGRLTIRALKSIMQNVTVCINLCCVTALVRSNFEIFSQ
jgi:hypothetical protein